MRIRCVRVSSAVRTFGDRLRAKYDLHKYMPRDRTNPVLFFGCYPPGPHKRPDIRIITRHKGLAVVVWCGSDALQLDRPIYRNIRKARHLVHIALGRFTSEDLSRAGLVHLHLPVCPTDPAIFEPCTLGPKVYVYDSHHTGDVYGRGLVAQIRKRVPDIEFITGYAKPPDHTLPESMPEIYRQCFLGLRLTKHDGLPNTVIELGAMGIRCLWNGWLPNAIPWKPDVNQIVRLIRREQSRIGQQYPVLAQRVRDSLKLPRNWLTTEFYKDLIL